MCLLYSGDEDMLFMGSSNGDISTWRLLSYSKFRTPIPRVDQRAITFTGHSEAVTELGYVSGQRLLYSSSMDQTIRLWDVDKACLLRCYRNGHTRGVIGIVLSPSTNLLLSAGLDAVVSVWNMYSEKAMFKIKGHSAALQIITTVLKTGCILTGDAIGIIKVWDGHNFMCLQTLSVGVAVQGVLEIGRNLIVFQDGVDTLCLEPEDSDTGQTERGIDIACYNPSNFTIVVASQRHLQIWSMMTGKLDLQLPMPTATDITALSYDCNYRRIATGESDGGLTIFNARTLECSRKLRKAGGEIAGLSWLSSPSRIVVMTVYAIRIVNEFGDVLFNDRSCVSMTLFHLADDCSLIFYAAAEITVFDTQRFLILNTIKDGQLLSEKKSSDNTVSATVMAFSSVSEVLVIGYSNGETIAYRCDKKGDWYRLGTVALSGIATAMIFCQQAHLYVGFASGLISCVDFKDFSSGRHQRSSSQIKAQFKEGRDIQCAWTKQAIGLAIRSLTIIHQPTYLLAITECGRAVFFDDDGGVLSELGVDEKENWKLRISTQEHQLQRRAAATTILSDLENQDNLIIIDGIDQQDRQVPLASSHVSRPRYIPDKSQTRLDGLRSCVKNRTRRSCGSATNSDSDNQSAEGQDSGKPTRENLVVASDRMTACLAKVASKHMLNNPDLTRSNARTAKKLNK
eukprot:CRZ05488.1 hypothetical protein [Spongospora subterranea]